MLTNFLVFTAVAFWGLSFISTKKVLPYLTPSEIITVRLLLGAPVLYLVARVRGTKFDFESKDRTVIIVAAIILGAHFLIQTLGLNFTTATNTAWLIATIPAFVAVLSRIFLKERLNLRRITGIALGTIGVILLVSKGNIGRLDWLYSFGDWLVLVTCLTWSVYTIITRNITRKYRPLALSVVILLIPAVSLSLVTLISTPLAKFYNLPLEALGWLLFLGIACLGLAHWFWLEGLSRKGAVEVGAYLYLEPVVTTIAAGPILGEELGLMVILSAVLILAGVYLVERKPRIPKPLKGNQMPND